MTTNKMSVVENNEATVESRERGPELSSYVPTDSEFAEFFGGGSEYLPFLTSPLWPFSLLHLFRREEE